MQNTFIEWADDGTLGYVLGRLAYQLLEKEQTWTLYDVINHDSIVQALPSHVSTDTPRVLRRVALVHFTDNYLPQLQAAFDALGEKPPKTKNTGRDITEPFEPAW